MEKGVIQAIKYFEWLASVVIAHKTGGKGIRLCVDLRALNECILIERHPLPRINEMFSTMGEASVFSVLDLSMAYHQIELHPDFHRLIAFTTPLGAYMFNRLPFGLALAASVFQKVMQAILGGLKNTMYFQDDVLVYGPSKTEHDSIVMEVLTLCKAGLTIKPEKCMFGVNSVEYLGHTISKDGFRPKLSLVDAVRNAPIHRIKRN